MTINELMGSLSRNVIIPGLVVFMSCSTPKIISAPLQTEATKISEPPKKTEKEMIMEQYLRVVNAEDEMAYAKVEQRNWPVGTHLYEVYENIFDDAERKYLIAYNAYCKTRENVSLDVLTEINLNFLPPWPYNSSSGARIKVKMAITEDGTIFRERIGSCLK